MFNRDLEGQPTLMVCEECNVGVLIESIETQKFRYGTGDDLVELQADIPVISCSHCGEMFTDQRAEREQHNAVCRHLGRLTPDELVSLRGSYSLSQAAFADLTGYGSASIKRWESGNQIQTISADRLLRLCRDRRVFEMLRKNASVLPGSSTLKPHNKFRTYLSPRTRREAQAFSLCSSHPVEGIT